MLVVHFGAVKTMTTTTTTAKRKQQQKQQEQNKRNGAIPFVRMSLDCTHSFPIFDCLLLSGVSAKKLPRGVGRSVTLILLYSKASRKAHSYPFLNVSVKETHGSCLLNQYKHRPLHNGIQS